MADAGSRLVVARTPPKKAAGHHHRTRRCQDCPCQRRFRSDDAVTSAVDSDERADALIGWLSGGSATAAGAKASGGAAASFAPEEAGGGGRPCPNRLSASVVVLNAIRDACRPYLEATACAAPPPTAAVSSPPGKVGGANKPRPKLNETVAYEDSFPSLSSAFSSAPAPAAATLLVGRKKKGAGGPRANGGPPSKPPQAAAPTLLVGRKKSKQAKNGRQPPNHGVGHSTKSNSDSLVVEPRKVTSNAASNIAAPKAKKKIRPVTISLSSAPSPSSSGLGEKTFQSIKAEGNISSLPSQDTTELLVGTAASPFQTPQSAFSSPSRTRSVNDSLPTSAVPSTGAETKASDGPPGAANEKPVDLPKLRRLARIYSTILRSRLAPFLLLELHLLVRLVSLPDASHGPKIAADDARAGQPFSEVLSSERSCREFAAETLAALEAVIVNMGHEAIKMLAALPALRAHCPGLVAALRETINAGESALLFEADRKALGSGANTPHLTLPFDSARDSRHNYRSADLNRLYREREELRDAFLYQLRAFQDVRGRLVEHEQAERQIASIREESREMLKNLSTGNALWFVTFFCDLLLQVGLVPISETDSEVLKQIGDEERLQKLHMRFTSKSGQTDKSSRNLRIDQKGPSQNAKAAPEQSFTGHQEFFSLFLSAGDSYKFNTHLRRRLAQLVTEMSAVNETKGLCEHMAKTQMLAKFLGMLVFSPNWGLANGSHSDDAENENEGMSLLPIDINECIRAAWDQYRLIVVVPWVIQFLGMMKWDDSSRRLQYYLDTFALLWSINHHCIPYQLCSHSFYQTNMALLSFLLDAFFSDIVGLAPSQRLTISALPSREPSESTVSTTLPFDTLPLWFSKPSLYPMVPHLKDLCELLKDLVHNSRKAVITSSAKKIRPESISDFDGIDSRFTSRIAFSAETMSPWSNKRPGTPVHRMGIKDRLVDSFFHQQKDLQQLCEMVVDCAVKNFTEVASACILPIYYSGATSFEEYFGKSPSMTLEEYTKLVNALDAKAKEEASDAMNKDFDRVIRGALPLLASSTTQPKVVEVTSKLAIDHAVQKGRSVITSIINEEKKKLMEEFVRKEKKVKAGVPLVASKISRASTERPQIESNSPDLKTIANLTEMLRALSESDDHDVSLKSLAVEKEKAIGLMQRYYMGAGLPKTVTEFEAQIVTMIQDFFSNPMRLLLLQAVIEISDLLSLLGRLGYAGLSGQKVEDLLCDTQNILTLVETSTANANDAHIIAPEKIAHLLFTLVDGSLLCHRALENVLLHAVKSCESAVIVSNILLQKLGDSAGTDDVTGGFVFMVRLQRRLQAT